MGIAYFGIARRIIPHFLAPPVPPLARQLSKVQEVQMDSNPYKSPPPDLLAEGISTVMQYVRVRMQRIDFMYKLIKERYAPPLFFWRRGVVFHSGGMNSTPG